MLISIRNVSHFFFFVIFLPILSLFLGYYTNFIVGLSLDGLNSSNAQLLATILGGASVMGFYVILFNSFDTFAWKWSIFRVLKIVDFPSIEGEWTGSLENNQGHKVKELTFNIKQRFSSFSVQGKFDLSDSCSTSSLLNYNQDTRRWEFVFQYRNTPNTKASSQDLGIHDGLSIMYLDGDALLCRYYNDSQFRGNSGTIKLEKHD